MKIFFLLLFSCLTFESTWAQESKSIAEIDYFKKAQSLFYTDIDSTIYYLKNGIPYYRDKKDWVTYVNCYNGLSSCYYTLGDYEKSMFYVGMAREEAKKWIGKNNLAYAGSLNNLAQTLTQKGKYKEAIAYFKESVAVRKELGETELYINALGNLGKCLRIKGDVDEAIRYFNMAISAHNDFAESKAFDLARMYNNLSKAYIEKQTLDTALVMLQKSTNIFIDPNTPKGKVLMPMRIAGYFSLADIYSQLNEPKAFFENIATGQKLELNYLNQLSEVGYSLKGNWFLKNNETTKAVSQFEKALAAVKDQKSSFDFHPQIGKAYIDLGMALSQQSFFEAALINYQSALKHFSNDEPIGSSLGSPPLASLISDNNLVDLLHHKGKCLHQLYLQEPDNRQEYLSAATQTFELAVQVISRLRKEFLSEESKEYLSSLTGPLFEDALNCQVQLYTQSPSPENLERVFQLTEANKAAILSESINENLAKGISGIPDSLIEKELALRREIATYEKNIYESKWVENASAKKIANLENEVFELRNSHQELITTFETQYPDFYRLKYQTSPAVSLMDVQKNLPDDQSALLQYFAGQEKIYALLIAKNKATIHSIKRAADLTANVETLRSILHQSPNSQIAQSDFPSFTSAAHYLYQELVAPVNITDHIQRLIIIPDDLLGYIPFEILLSKDAQLNKASYKSQQLHYLIRDFQISYNYSSALWLRSNSLKNNAGKSFLGFAPNFGGSNAEQLVQRNCVGNELSALNCNVEEVNQLAELIDGRALLAAQANKDNFLANANQYKILHFATHSCLDDRNPMLNKIFLSDDYLSNYDLYNLKLESELTVLSACDTGNGPLLKGEGIMSLFRGFLHAGCPSSLISLWSVEDCSTKDIMQYYYQYLNNGLSKDAALRNAKLDYLSQADRLRSHPFYWAPFVQFGSTAPLSIDRGISKYWWLAGVGMLLIGVFVGRWVMNGKSVGVR